MKLLKHQAKFCMYVYMCTCVHMYIYVTYICYVKHLLNNEKKYYIWNITYYFNALPTRARLHLLSCLQLLQLFPLNVENILSA